MDLPPAYNMITDNINNFSNSAHQKLQEAQSIMQSALDTHMLLSHYDFYKQFSNNIADDLQAFKNDISGSSNISGSLMPDLTDMFNYGQQKLKEAKSTYSQLMNMKNEAINTAKAKADEAAQKIADIKKAGSDMLEDTNMKIGDTVKTLKTDAKGKLQNMQSIAEDETNKLKVKAQQQLNDSINDIKGKQASYEDMLSNIKLEEPDDIKNFFTNEELSGNVTKTPFLNEYYGTRYNPEDDIFNEAFTMIKPYKPAVKKIKGVKKVKNNTKKKMTEDEEAQKSQVVEEPNLKPSKAIKQLESEGVTMKGDLPTAVKMEPEQNINRFEDEATDDLRARYDMLQNSARSEMAEQDMKDIGQELTNRVISGMDMEKSIAPISETMTNIENEGARISQTINDTIAQPVAQIQENLINQSQNISRVFQSLSQPLSDTVNDIQTQIKSGVADGLSKAKSMLTGATEESLGGDEDPIGLGVTVVLGLADLGTQIASLFEGSPKQPAPEQISKQIGV